MGAFGALSRGLAKSDDILRLLDTTGGVARIKRSMPALSESQLQFNVQRGRDLQKTGSMLDTKRGQLEAVSEVKNDPANLARVGADDPETGAMLKKYQDRPDPGAKVEDRFRQQIKKADEKQSSQLSNVAEFTADDPKTFRQAEALRKKKQLEVEMRGKGKLGEGEYLEQHHLISKGVMGAFMGRADELIAKGKATQEDLLAMAEYLKEQTGTAGGDRASNMLNMRKQPHNEFHTTMEVGEGVEESKKVWQKRLSKVNSIDELFQYWEEWVLTDGKYTKDTAEIWEPLDDLIKEIQGK